MKVPKTKGVTKVCDHISLRCHQPGHLVITSINATTSLAKTILEQCNFKGGCRVLNPHRECVQLKHGCRGKMPSQEIREGSHFYREGNISFLNLMSTGYHKGNYMKAQQLNCTLKFTEKIHQQVKVIINEFSPYTATKDFCFKVENAQQPPFCSGSKALNINYGTFEGNTQWKFGMSLAAGTKNVPKVRFWLTIAVHPNFIYHLECHSDAVPNSSTHHHFDVYIIYSPIGGISLLALLAFGFVFFWKKCNKARRPSDQSVDHEYTYIDVGDRSNASSQDVLRTPNHLSQSSRIQQLELPPIPREEQKGIEEVPGTDDGYLSSRVQQRVQNPPSTMEANLNQLLPQIASSQIQQLQVSSVPRSQAKPADDQEYCMDNSTRPSIANDDVQDSHQDEEASEEEASNNSTMNEYFGLSQETRNETNANPRSSVTKLYTLLEGKPSDDPAKIVLNEPDSSLNDEEEHSSSGGNLPEHVCAEVHKGESEPVASIRNDTSHQDKDEHGYLVLLPGETFPLPGSNRGKNN